MNIKDRFLAKVRISSSECWEWLGAKHPSGYGRIKVDGKAARAHRVSYILFKGPIPPGLLVCHTCDNPQCTKPEHLFLGTNLDNTRDMMKKRRNRSGRVGRPRR